MDNAWAFSTGAKPGISWPVVRLKARMLDPGNLLGPGGGAGGPGVVESSGNVDGVSDDDGLPRDAIMLGGGQTVGGDRDRRLRIVGVRRR